LGEGIITLLSGFF